MDELDISYALAKKVPDMRRGFRVETSYGEMEVSAQDAKPFADLMQRILERRLTLTKKARPEQSDAEVREAVGGVFGLMK